MDKLHIGRMVVLLALGIIGLLLLQAGYTRLSIVPVIVIVGLTLLFIARDWGLDPPREENDQ